jgi:enamine deaminase RidA (YjgF/YER057c/UK114 family)
LYSSEKSKETKKYNEAIKSLQRAYRELSSIKGQIPVNIQQDENGNISVTEETEEAKGQIDQVLETINTILDNMVGEEGSTYVTANNSNTIYSVQASLVAMGNGIDLLY